MSSDISFPYELKGETDPRFPYTHAADFIRRLSPWGEDGVVISRSDASKIIAGVAEAIGMTKEDLAEKLAKAHINDMQSELPALSEEAVTALREYYNEVESN